MKLTKLIDKEFENITSVTQGEIKTNKNITVETLLAIWKQTKIYADYKNPEPDYQSIVFPEGRKSVEKAAMCTSEDIAGFCILSNGTNKEIQSLGFFLSSIINKHYAKTGFSGEYVLPVDQKETLIDGIGFQNNGANIKIIGDVGYMTGKTMEAGNITIIGNAFSVGEAMYDGRITVFGNVDSAGKNMQGGIIHITENAGFIGDKMKNGKIIVEKNGFYAGESMQYGHIIIKGDIEQAGDKMKDGLIEIFGNCKNKSSAENGKINIHKKYDPST